jgi:dipeptidyl-peptidase 4
MRTFRGAILCLFALALLLGDGRLDAQATSRWLTYEQAFPSLPAARPGSGVLGDLPAITGWLDAQRYLETRTGGDGERRLYVVDAADGRAQVFRDYAAMKRDLPKGADPARPAANTDDYRRAIYVADGDIYLYDAASGRVRRLTATPEPERTPRFSPDGRWVAYTRANNLFAYDLDGQIERQYTSDGSDTVYNGWASWVYYEEILGRASQYAAFWWSPDSSTLAFMRFDDSPVPIFPIYDAAGQHGVLEQQRYPKAGDPNPHVRMGMASVSDGAVVWADFDPKADHYIAWPFWTPDSKTLTVQWMNRGQDTIRFYNCDAATGAKRQIFEEKQDAWVEFFEDLYYFRDGSGFLLRSNVDGWDHLYYYASDGTLKRRLTEGDFRVASIEHVDEPGGFVYYTMRPAGATWDVHLMRVRLDGSGAQRLTSTAGQHTVQVSPGGRYFIDTFSNITTPPQMMLRRGDGTLVRNMGDALTPSAAQVTWGRGDLFTIPSGDGFDLPASWVLPPDFDPSRRYPVIFTVYGGPDAGRTFNVFPHLQAHYWAQRGVITISVDHRGSGHFGKKGAALMHRNLGKWEMHDLSAAATWLRTKSFIAGDRIGVVGGSYGGYVTLMALSYGAGTFNYGQAGSAVTDWRLYDTVYTERFMDKPDENPEGYKNGAVLTWIDRYTGGLRITHGTIDDNVHLQNSLQVVDWLTANNRPFELMLYPGSRHGLRPVQRAHQNRESHEFWVRRLLDGRMPVERPDRSQPSDLRSQPPEPAEP